MRKAGCCGVDPSRQRSDYERSRCCGPWSNGPAHRCRWDALIEAAWPGQAVEDSNLTVQIAAIRRVLGAAPGGDGWIETMPRRGYRFVGPLVTEAQNGVVASPLQAKVGQDLAPVRLAPAPTPDEHAERRQITALSCELIRMSRRVDGTD